MIAELSVPGPIERILLLSDLHLEFGSWAPAPSAPDLVLLAGDINLKGRSIAWAKETFECPVLHILGNHEFYRGNLVRTLADMREQAAGSQVRVLENEVAHFEGLRVIGATLWTDFRLTGNEPLAKWDAQTQMNDYKVIRDGNYSKIKPDLIARMHARSRAFIEDQLNEPFDGVTLVMSHHAPCELSLHERFQREGSHLNASYASRLDHLMGASRAQAWVHGHTHDSFDYEIDGTRVVCNPRGYAPNDLNPDFNERLTLSVSELRARRDAALGVGEPALGRPSAFMRP